MSCSKRDFLTEEADLDLCGDEIIWATPSYCELGAGVTGRVKNNPGVNKVGQSVLLGNVTHIRQCSYMHRHKLHRKPPGWTVMGNIEVKNIM